MISKAFDHLKAVAADDCSLENTRLLETWLVAQDGLDTTTRAVHFIRSCMSLPSDKRKSFIKKHSPELLHHFTLLDALARIEKPEPPTELITLAPLMDRCYRCLCHLSVHNGAFDILHSYEIS